MAEYPDRIIQLHVRLEQIAMFADGKTKRVLSDMQDRLAIHLLKSGVPGTKNAWQVMERAYLAISKEAMKEVDAIIERNATAGIENAHAAEVASMAQLGVDAKDYFKAVDASGVYNRGMRRALPGLGKGVEMTAQEMMNKMYRGNNAAVISVVRRGFAEGLSVPQMSRLIRDSTDLTYKQAKSVTRTAIQATANQARDDVAEELDEFINKEMWMATLDSRTCPYCQGRDGLCKAKGKLPRPPAHPNCRCVMLYIPEGTSCKQMKDDLSRPYRDPETGKSIPSPYKDYGSWIQTQPRWFQDQVLGKRRAQLLRDGKIEFSKMFTRQGDQKTLVELGVIKPKPKPKPIPQKTAGAKFPHDASNNYYPTVPPQYKAPHHDKFLGADSGFTVAKVDLSRDAFYRAREKVINMFPDRDQNANRSVVYLHEFGHRIDDFWGPVVHKRWQGADRPSGDITTTQRWLYALGDDAKGMKNTGRDGFKALGGQGRYRKYDMWEKHSDYLQSVRNEALDKAVEGGVNTTEMLHKMAEAELSGDYAEFYLMTKDWIRQRRVAEKEGNSFHKKAKVDDNEREMISALLSAQRTGSEQFILKDWLDGFIGQNTPRMDRFGVYLADSIEGTTSSKYGFGHGKSYFSDPYSRGAEVFANLNAMWGWQPARAFFRRYMPNQTKLWEEFLEEVDKGIIKND